VHGALVPFVLEHIQLYAQFAIIIVLVLSVDYDFVRLRTRIYFLHYCLISLLFIIYVLFVLEHAQFGRSMSL